MHGRDTCYHHGGATPRGYGLPQTTHGRYSKVLPLRLAARYEEARNNKNLLSLRDDIAVAESRLSELLGHLATGESGALWQTLRETLEAFTLALAQRDGATMNAHLATMRHVITQGTDDTTAWGEIQKLWDTRCRLIATEQKTLIAERQTVTVEQLMIMMGVVTNAIQRIVPAYTDQASARNILGALSTEFNRISLLENGAEA
jgi:hypothetical protein